MAPWLIVILVILAIVLVGLIVLYIVGRKMQKKQDETMPDILANAQLVTMLIIDKKRMKLKEAGFPQVVMEQTPKYMRGAKVPVVKAKVGPRVMNLMCDEKIFDDIPLKKEVKAKVNGIYIIEVRGLRRSAQVEEPVKEGFFKKAKREARKEVVKKNAEKAKKSK
jgi:uncharacterized protein YneF (UPF0154 family)